MAVQPRYRQIADDLRRKIDDGKLTPGSRLPTEQQLRKETGASRNTIRDAVKFLVTLGLVETRPGRGTFVMEKENPFVTTLTGDPTSSLGGGEGSIYIAEVAASGRTPRTDDPKVEIHKADPAVADALRIAEGASVISRHQERFIDDKPWSLQTSFYPMSLVERGAARLIDVSDIIEGAVLYLARECGVRQVGYRDSIAVRTPNLHESSFFRIPVDGRVPVFEIHRVSFDENGERIRLTVTVYPSDRNRLRVVVGEVPPRSGAKAKRD